eukprot:TRINITY_DN52929_c0_g1_i1.p1 TRINITY_DN52929_c0_g1~~TRINITY_DN52929_c0_g1_i1.p1  ORF type:complete len:311 (-),score=6.97 TRINITY_DN52929_c0_g1_i1:155-1087(-)
MPDTLPPPIQVHNAHHHSRPGGKKTLESVILGGIAGGFAKCLTYPLERVKTIGQTSTKPLGLHKAFLLAKDVAHHDGWGALWKGNTISVARTVPYIGIAYGCYDLFEALVENQISDVTASRFIAGSLSGVVAATLTYPLDVLRSRMAASRVATQYKQTMLHSHESYRWMIRGLGPTLFGVIPYAGLSFGTFETCKAKMKQRLNTEKLSPVQHMLCGATAGVVSQTLTYPIDTLRKRLQTDVLLVHLGERRARDYRGRGVFATAKGMLVTEGWRTFFRGAELNFLKAISAASLSFAANEYLKDRYLPKDQK